MWILLPEGIQRTTALRSWYLFNTQLQQVHRVPFFRSVSIFQNVPASCVLAWNDHHRVPVSFDTTSRLRLSEYPAHWHRVQSYMQPTRQMRLRGSIQNAWNDDKRVRPASQGVDDADLIPVRLLRTGKPHAKPVESEALQGRLLLPRGPQAVDADRACAVSSGLLLRRRDLHSLPLPVRTQMPGRIVRAHREPAAVLHPQQACHQSNTVPGWVHVLRARPVRAYSVPPWDLRVVRREEVLRPLPQGQVLPVGDVVVALPRGLLLRRGRFGADHVPGGPLLPARGVGRLELPGKDDVAAGRQIQVAVHVSPEPAPAFVPVWTRTPWKPSNVALRRELLASADRATRVRAPVITIRMVCRALLSCPRSLASHISRPGGKDTSPVWRPVTAPVTTAKVACSTVGPADCPPRTHGARGAPHRCNPCGFCHLRRCVVALALCRLH